MDHGEHWNAPVIDADEALIDSGSYSSNELHRRMGPGLFESVYELATMVELQEVQVPARHLLDIPVRYRDRDLGIRFRDDIIVKDCLLLEKALRFKRGFLINFNKTLLKEGIKRVSI